MAWDNDDNSFSLYIYKNPCPECSGDMVMIYEPYKDKSGTRICGHVCVDCGFARYIDSQMFFPLYTGKYKRDEWVVDEDDLEDFHEDAQAVIRNMKAGRFFRMPRQRKAPPASRPKNTAPAKPQSRQPAQDQRTTRNTRQEQDRQSPQSRPSQVRQDQTGSGNNPFSRQGGYQAERQFSRGDPVPDNKPIVFMYNIGHLYNTGDYKGTVDACRQKLRAGSKLDREELFQYAYSLDELGMYKEAIEAWTEYLTRFRNSSDVAVVYNNRGVAYSRINDPERSTEDYRQAIAHGYIHSDKLQKIINQRESQKHLDNAKNQYRAGNYSYALSEFEAVRRLGYDLGNFWFEYGYCLSRAERTNDAISAYTKYISMDPGSTAAYKNRGILYKKIGENKKFNVDFWYAYHLSKDQGEKTKILNSLYESNKAARDIASVEAVLVEKRLRNEADETDAGKFFMAEGSYQKAIDCFSRTGHQQNRELLLRCKVEYALARKAYREAYDYISGSHMLWDAQLCRRVFFGLIEGVSDSRRRELVEEAMESAIFSKFEFVRTMYEQFVEIDRRRAAEEARAKAVAEEEDLFFIM